MDEYTQMLEMQLRFAEEEKQQEVAMAYEQGKADRDKELSEHCVFISNRPIEDIVLEARAEERTNVLDEILRKHNNCNTDLCEYANTNISCCECIVRKLKEQSKCK